MDISRKQIILLTRNILSLFLVVFFLFADNLKADYEPFEEGFYDFNDCVGWAPSEGIIKTVGILVYGANGETGPTPFQDTSLFINVLWPGAQNPALNIIKENIGDPIIVDFPVASLSHYSKTISFGKLLFVGKVEKDYQFFCAMKHDQTPKEEFNWSASWWANVDQYIDFSKYERQTGSPGIIDHIIIIATKDTRGAKKYGGYMPAIGVEFHTNDVSRRDGNTNMWFDPYSSFSSVVIIPYNADNERSVRKQCAHTAMHEYIHWMGLDDIYINYEDNYEAQGAGVGPRDIMSNALPAFHDSCNQQRGYPISQGPLCAYTLARLGWRPILDMTNWSAGQYYKNVYPIDSQYGNILKFRREGTSEYFLISLSLGYKHGYSPDQYHTMYPVYLDGTGEYELEFGYQQPAWMRQGGLDIFHCDEAGSEGNEWHPHVDLECADGRWTANRKYYSSRQGNSSSGGDDLNFWHRGYSEEGGYQNEWGDPAGKKWHPYWNWQFDNNDYFYADQGYSFTQNTNPNSNWRDNNNSQTIQSGFSITNIQLMSGSPPYYRLTINISGIGEDKNIFKNTSLLRLIYAGPNPVKDKFKLVFSKEGIPEKKGKIYFYNIEGKKVISSKSVVANLEGRNEIIISIPEVIGSNPSGIYFYRLNFGKKTLAGKLLYIK